MMQNKHLALGLMQAVWGILLRLRLSKKAPNLPAQANT